MGRTTCAAPVPTGFAPDPVVVALAEWVYLDAPQVAAYFGRARMPFAEMNKMLQQLGEAGRNGGERRRPVRRRARRDLATVGRVAVRGGRARDSAAVVRTAPREPIGAAS